MEYVEGDVLRRAALVFALGLLAAGASVWSVEWFVTQDGAAHLYNAHLLLALLKSDARVSQFYQAHWTPLPNWAGHLSLMALLSLLPARAADRVMITVTFAGLACAIAWLRVRVAGWGGATGAALLAVLLGLNWMWVMGFYSFLLGACLFAFTLGAWWAWRARFGGRAALGLAVLLVLGYFCHVVTVGMTAAGVVVLALLTPGADWARRVAWTLAACAPLAPLVWLYRGLMQAGGGPARPEWRYMSSVWSPRAWLLRWRSVETLQLSGKKFLPFSATEASWHALLSPTFLVALALILVFTAALIARPRRLAARPGWWREAARSGWRAERRGWWGLALLVWLGWLFAPDDFGGEHGAFLRPRLLLLALITLVPLLRFDLPALPTRLSTGLLAVALALQILWVWDYALLSQRTASEFLQAQKVIGSEQRIGTVLLPERAGGGTERRGFAARPVFHLDGLLGIGTGNVLWNNYEAAYYVFPVKYRDPAAFRRARLFDKANGVALPALFLAGAPGTPPGVVEGYFDQWRQLLARERDQIDSLIVWGALPELEATLRQWYGPEPVFTSGNLRVFRPKR